MSGTPHNWPVAGVCGFSGAGKTTLIEAVVPRFIARGLAVAVVKHDAHGLTIDRPGKDSDRFFRAGATVVVHDQSQSVRREHGSAAGDGLQAILAGLVRDHDLVLVEGHKRTALPLRIWLEGDDGAGPPPEAGAFSAVLPRNGTRAVRFEEFVDAHLASCRARVPLCAGLLVGGKSTRMGRPKSLLRSAGRSWAEAVHAALAASVPDVFLLGDGPVSAELSGLPRLLDVPDRAGPLAGMVGAMRWRPDAAWVFAACDMPLLDAESIAWLLSHRESGVWAVMPRRPGFRRVEPLGAWYGPRIRSMMESSDRPQAVAAHDRARVVEIPGKMADRWLGFNSRAQCAGRIEVDEP